MSYYSIEIPARETPQHANRAAGFGAIPTAISPVTAASDNHNGDNNSPTYEQVKQMIDQSISQMKVYVVESEITQSQNAVKTVVQQASF